MGEFDEIFRRYGPMVFRFLLSKCGDEALAEELTAETFYQAYLHIGQFRGECRIETWLCEIAKNALRKEQRRRGRFFGREPSESGEADNGFFDAIADKEQAMLAHKHLHALREPYREVFMLRVFGELSFRDIAGIFGRSEVWAKVTFYRAKNMLIEKMEGEK